MNILLSDDGLSVFVYGCVWECACVCKREREREREREKSDKTNYRRNVQHEMATLDNKIKGNGN